MNQKINNLLYTEPTYLYGNFEKRTIFKIKVDSTILKNLLNSTTDVNRRQISFNLMMMTNDHKVLLLQRSESFYFSKVIKDLKINKIDFKLLSSLYTSELEKIRKTFFDFLPPYDCLQPETKKIYIFPGGHSKSKETLILTLLRELWEETTIHFKKKFLRFNQSFIFKVSILDLMIQKHFENFVFPVKVDMSSHDIIQRFKETKHVRNLTFIDIHGCDSLFSAFLHVQNFMLI